MNPDTYVRYLLENMMILFCALFCYLPMGGQLKINPRRLFGMVLPVLLAYTVAASVVCTIFLIPTNTVLFPAAAIFFFLYRRTVTTGFFQCLFVYLHVCSFVCYPYLYGIVFDALMHPEGGIACLSYESLAFQYGLYLLLTGLYFAIRPQLRWIVEEFQSPAMWRILWIFPAFYMVTLIMIVPHNYDNLLYRGRSRFLFPLIVTAILISELMIIYLFYKAAHETMRNMDLISQNQLMQAQVHHYNSLRKHMEQTRQIRHDFRQQLRTIVSLSQSKQYEALDCYLSEYTETCSDKEQSSLCRNPAVDAIACYYRQLADSREILTDWTLDLPEKLPLPEPIFCGMLGNLVENAIDACTPVTEQEKIIHISANMPGSSILILIVENTYQGKIACSNDGKRFLSTKNKDGGIGLASVRAAVKRYHGNLQIDYNDRTFCVNILLNV